METKAEADTDIGEAMKRDPSGLDGPEPLCEIVNRLIVARGWGRRRGTAQLEQVWAETAGSETAAHTRVASFRRGVLEILVDNAVLLQELGGFRKRALLEKLRQRLKQATLHDLRFRSGTWK
ncbi:MAG: hypothetical protein KatS3mg105_2462 [Gemmatales bacterium]|nr:MAG: hypothetical protein KatS3mg105_2462 [Gemmatales bacterium]